MDVPAAINVVTPEVLKDKGIIAPTDLISDIPSLQQTGSGYGDSVPKCAIRGQHQQISYIQTDGSVGVYIDDVVLPRQHGLNGAFFDLSNVQVLKGPQGTRFTDGADFGPNFLGTTSCFIGAPRMYTVSLNYLF